MEAELKKRLLALRGKILENFENSDWDGIEQLRQQSEVLRYYPRLLLNLTKENESYPGEVLSILRFIATTDPRAFKRIESQVVLHILDRRYYRRAIVPPKIFATSELPVLPDLVAVLMPLQKDFSRVFSAVEAGCSDARLHCRRADDVWEDSAVMQDVFNLVFHSGIVVADFTGKNSNVLYETGIAHALGKQVVPISQSLDDVPFDLIQHGVLKYSSDPDGLRILQARLGGLLPQIMAPIMEAASVIEGTEIDTAKVVPIRQRS